MTRGRPARPPGASATLAAWLAASVLLGGVARAQGPGPVGAPPDSAPEELVMALEIGRDTLLDGFIAVRSGERLYLPLGALAAALQLPLAIDEAAGTVAPLAGGDRFAFGLDPRRGAVTLGGVAYALPAGGVLTRADGLYVERDLLRRLIGLDLSTDFLDLTVTVAGPPDLPFLAARERAARQERLRRQRGGADQGLLAVEPPAPMVSVPLVDVTHETRREAQGGVPRLEARTSLLAGFSAADQDVRLALTHASFENRVTARVRVGRDDEEGRLLGPLRATAYAVGDIGTQPVPLAARSGFGRGATVSTFPAGLLQDASRLTFTGELPPGWEVELYRNGALIDALRDAEGGRFRFDDVAAVRGRNEFRIVRYGPQGQRDETVEIVQLDDALLRPGRLALRLSANQPGRDLIGGAQSVVEGRLRPVATDAGGRPVLVREPLDHRLVGDAAYGVSERLTLVAGVVREGFESGDRTLLTAGARAVLGALFLRADAVADPESGAGAELGLQTDVAGLELTVEHGEFRDLETDLVAPLQIGDPLARRSRLRVAGEVGETGLRLAQTVQFSQSEASRNRLASLTQASGTVGPVRLTGLVSYLSESGSEADLGITLLASGTLERLNLRGSLEGALRPEAELERGEVTATYRFSEQWQGVAELDLDPQEESAFGIGAAYRGERFGIELLAGIDTAGTLEGRLALATSFGLDPLSGDLSVSRRTVTKGGAVALRIFEDRDADGRFSPGDAPLPQVRVSIDGRREGPETGPEGTVLATGLATGRPVRLAVALDSVADPSLAPRAASVVVSLRPGVVTPLDLPLIATADLDGTVLRVGADGNAAALGGVPVELLDGAGRIVATEESAFDGRYYFASVPLGRYVVRLAPRAGQGTALEPGLPVTLARGQTGVAGLDLRLR